MSATPQQISQIATALAACDTYASGEPATGNGVDSFGQSYTLGDILVTLGDGRTLCTRKTVDTDTYADAVVATSTGTDAFNVPFGVGDKLIELPDGRVICIPSKDSGGAVPSAATSAGTDSFSNTYNIGDTIVVYPDGSVLCQSKVVDTAATAEIATTPGFDASGDPIAAGDEVITVPGYGSICIPTKPEKEVFEATDELPANMESITVCNDVGETINLNAGDVVPADVNGSIVVDEIDGTATWVPCKPVDRNKIEYSCINGATDTERLSKAINFVNSVGSIGTGDGGSFQILLDVPLLDIPDGSAVPAIVVDGVHVQGCGIDTTAIRSNTGEMFTIGDGVSFVDSTTLESFSFYSSSPDASLTLAKKHHGTRLTIRDVELYEIPTLLELEAAPGKVTSNIFVENVIGSVANLGQPTIWSHGNGVSAGLYMDNVRLFPNGVINPPESSQDSHAALPGTDFLRIDTQFDTILVDQTVINRYDRGVRFTADIQGRGIGNAYFTEFVADYQNTAVELNAAGGNVTKINFDDGWLNSTDGRTVNLIRSGGLLEHIVVENNDLLMSGTENVVIPAVSSGVRIRNNRIFGTGRLSANSDGIRAESTANEYEITGNEWVNSQPYYGTAGVRLPSRAIVVQGANDTYRIQNNYTRSSGAGYQIPVATSGLRERILRDNRKSDGTLPEYMTTGTIAPPASGDPYINHTGSIVDIYTRGGTVSQSYINGIQIGANQQHFTLDPGESMAIDYAAAPVFVVTYRG